LQYCPPGARIIDTAPMSLDEIEAEYVRAAEAGDDVARLHSGDLSVWSAVAEQIRRLEKNGIAYTMTPGVPAFAAAAATLGRELTIPAVAQSLVLTRVSGRASPMPNSETLAAFGATGSTLAIHLAIHALGQVVEELTPLYGADCPVAIVAKASWPDERVVRGTLGDIAARVAADPIERTALIFVGPGLEASDFRESSLYDPPISAASAGAIERAGIVQSAIASFPDKTRGAAEKRRLIIARSANGPFPEACRSHLRGSR
jgi:precorrin-4/cobalt-precorrin-4 C11-methyltransferase